VDPRAELGLLGVLPHGGNPGGGTQEDEGCRLMTKSWVERHMSQQMEDFKALAEMTVSVPA
jgi:hypothetical protein